MRLLGLYKMGKLKIFIRSKKAKSISITLLVFMALLLSISSLFILMQAKNNYSRQLYGQEIMSNFYAECESFEFTLKILAEETISGLKDSEQPFNREDFIISFKHKYRLFTEQEIVSHYYIEYLDKIENGDYSSLTLNNNKLSFVLNNFEFKKTPELGKTQRIGIVNYTKNIGFEIGF